MDIDLSTLQLKKLSDNNTSLTKSFDCSDDVPSDAKFICRDK